MSININNEHQVLDEAENLIKNLDLSDMIDEDLDKKENYTPEELERAKKRYLKEQYLKKLELTDVELVRFTHKDYRLDDIRNQLEIKNFFSTLGNEIYSIMDNEIYDNYTRLIRDEKFLRQIKDKRFQKYISIRKRLHALKKKLETSEAPNKNYLLTELLAIIKRLDSYISSYLMVLLILSNTTQMEEFINSKLKQKRKTLN